eukprot:103552_1
MLGHCKVTKTTQHGATPLQYSARRHVTNITLRGNSELCCICLESISLCESSSIDQCEHIYHKDCILSWSRIENACPLCKKRFNTIHDRTTNNKINIDFKVQPSNYYIDFDITWVDCVCDKCGSTDNEQLLLFCNECDCVSHSYCVDLDNNIQYYCDECSEKKIKQRKKEQKRLKEWQNCVGIRNDCNKYKIKTYARKNKRYKPKPLKKRSLSDVNINNNQNDEIKSQQTQIKCKIKQNNKSSLNELPSPLLSSNILIICGIDNKKRVLRFRGNVNGKYYGSSLANLFTYSNKCQKIKAKSCALKQNRKRKYDQIDSNRNRAIKRTKYNHSVRYSSLAYL